MATGSARQRSACSGSCQGTHCLPVLAWCLLKVVKQLGDIVLSSLSQAIRSFLYAQSLGGVSGCHAYHILQAT